MKKLIISGFLFVIVLSCESQKGSWTYEDKERARKDLESGISKDGSIPDYMRESIDCTINRLELHYENFQEVEFDQEGAKKIIDECIEKYFLEAIKKNDKNENNSPAGE